MSAGVHRLRTPVGLAAFVLAGLSALWWRFHAPAYGTHPVADFLALTGDLLNYYVPMAEHAGRRLAAGELPLWNPFACSGIPFLATMQVGVFYPPAWPTLLLPPEVGFPLRVFGECALAGWLCALFFRGCGCGAPAAAIGGLLYVFALVLGHAFWPPMVSALVWPPWLFLCVEKLARAPRAGWWIGLSLGTCLEILAGFPQYLVYAFYALVPFAILRLLETTRSAPRRVRSIAVRSAAIASAVAIGVGLSGPQLLPTLELVAQSPRAESLPPEEVHYLNLETRYTLPRVLRNAVDPSPDLVTPGFGPGDGYVGIPTLVFLAVGLFAQRRRPLAWALVGLGALALFLADGYLGIATRLYDVYARLPVVGNLRTPERLRALAYAAAIALAVLGIDAIGRARDPRRRRGLAAALVVASLAVAIAMAAGDRLAGSWRVAAALLPGLALLRWPAHTALRASAWASLLLAVAIDCALATGTFGSLRALPMQLARTFHSGRDLSTGASIDAESLARHRRETEPRRLEILGFLPHLASAPSDGTYRMACYEPLLPGQWPALYREITGEPNLVGIMAGLDPRRFDAVYDAASVARALFPRRKEVRVLENPDALPRAYLVGSYRVADQAEAFARLLRGELRLRELVLLDAEPAPAPVVAAAGEPTLVPAELREYAPERVVVEARSDRPAVLVLTDTDYPGWRARVDGEPAPILRANGLFRAVALPPGQHRVVFEYRPASLTRGAALALGSAVALLGGTGVIYFTARRAARRQTPGP